MPDELDRMIDAGASVLGIPLQTEWRDAIRFHLALSLRMAQPVAAFPLPDETDPAPVFHA